jgi:hypothetical protein
MQRDFTVIFTWLHPFYYSSSSFLPPFLEQFQQVSLFNFYTRIKGVSTIFTFLYPLYLPSPFPLASFPGQDLFCLFVILLLKCILMGQRVFTLAFYTCIYICTLLILIPILFFLSLSLLMYTNRLIFTPPEIYLGFSTVKNSSISVSSFIKAYHP